MFLTSPRPEREREEILPPFLPLFSSSLPLSSIRRRLPAPSLRISALRREARGATSTASSAATGQREAALGELRPPIGAADGWHRRAGLARAPRNGRARTKSLPPRLRASLFVGVRPSVRSEAAAAAVRTPPLTTGKRRRRRCVSGRCSVEYVEELGLRRAMCGNGRAQGVS